MGRPGTTRDRPVEPGWRVACLRGTRGRRSRSEQQESAEPTDCRTDNCCYECTRVTHHLKQNLNCEVRAVQVLQRVHRNTQLSVRQTVTPIHLMPVLGQRNQRMRRATDEERTLYAMSERAAAKECGRIADTLRTPSAASSAGGLGGRRLSPPMLRKPETERECERPSGRRR